MVSLTDEMKEQLSEAATQTNRAYLAVRRGREAESPEKHATFGEPAVKGTPMGRLFGAEVSCMQPILRFLQLLCENHNMELQVAYCILLINSFRKNSSELYLMFD